jgi:magnesium chelatase family protein
MYGQISTLAFIGIEAVAESRERVRNALHAVGLGLPFKHITVNLAPADLPKEGSHFDLPIVLAMMSAMEAIAPDAIASRWRERLPISLVLRLFRAPTLPRR